MEEDNETTATQLCEILIEKGHKMSLKTIIRCRDQLGWTFHGSKYCQLVHVHVRNEEKPLSWAMKCEEDKEPSTTLYLQTKHRYN